MHLILLHKLYHSFNESLRVSIKDDLIVWPVAFFKDNLNDLICFPLRFKDAYRFPVLKGNGEFVNGADAPTAKKYGVR